MWNGANVKIVREIQRFIIFTKGWNLKEKGKSDRGAREQKTVIAQLQLLTKFEPNKRWNFQFMWKIIRLVRSTNFVHILNIHQCQVNIFWCLELNNFWCLLMSLSFKCWSLKKNKIHVFLPSRLRCP